MKKQGRFKKLTFTVGLLLVVSSFFIDHAKDIPLVERVISPRTYYIEHALVSMDNGGYLTNEDRAFNYILDICPLPSDFNKKTITALVKDGNVIDQRISPPLSYFFIGLFSNNTVTRYPDCDSNKIRQKNQNRKVLLNFGLFLVILGFVIKK